MHRSRRELKLAFRLAAALRSSELLSHAVLNCYTHLVGIIESASYRTCLSGESVNPAKYHRLVIAISLQFPLARRHLHGNHF